MKWLIIAGLSVIIFFFRKQIVKRWFAWFMSQWTKTPDPKMAEMKKEFFKDLSSHVSYLPELRKENTLKILEIGVGTGVNFAYYPDGTRLVVVDPNPYFKTYYDANRSKFKNIYSEDINVCSGEEMDMIENNSIDVVVTTLVLCSVVNIPKLLNQILRVLVPGGKFYFLEHIREFDEEKHGWRLLFQNILTHSRIWPTLFDGCELNRDIKSSIEAVGFSSVSSQHTYAPIQNFVFQLVKPHVLGTATK